MASKPNILIVEDDAHMGLMIEANLQMAGFSTRWAKHGMEAVEHFGKEAFDLCLVDIMLPKLDGFGVVREIRKADAKAPFIFLTAKSMMGDKFAGFQEGCDDYITKPFELQELIWRINAVLNRTRLESSELSESLTIGSMQLEPTERVLSWPGGSATLSAKENALVHLFGRNANEVLSRSKILKEVWGADNYFHSKSLDVYLTKVRKLLAVDPHVQLQNIHGYGYKLAILGPDAVA